MKVSVIVPSYNACERLYYNLLSLSRQDCSKDLFEVIIIDNGSSDNTRSMLDYYDNKLNIKKIRKSKNVGRAKARNIGIDAAKGEIIIFSDCDMISDETFISEHIKAHSQPDIVACGVNWEKIYTYYYKKFNGYLERNLLSVIDKYKIIKDVKVLEDKYCLIPEEMIIDGRYKEYSFTYAIYDYKYNNILERYGPNLDGYNFPWSFFVTNNCSVRKDAIIQAGMFDENFKGWGCEDLDLGYRLYKNGCKYRKLNIKSIHQEHPIKPLEGGIDNIYYFSDKYDSINILLFYFHGSAALDSIEANELAKEINKISSDPEYDILIDTFKALLKAARDKFYNDRIDKQKHIQNLRDLRECLVSNKQPLQEMCSEITRKYEGKLLCDTFVMLAKRISKVELIV